MIREISIRIENEPGRMFRVARALGDAGIDITALSVAGSETAGVLRLIVSDTAAARRTLMRLDLPAAVGEVVAVAIPDTPGSLAGVLALLEAQSINVVHLYAFRRTGSERAVVVMHTDRDEDVEGILETAGMPLVDEEALRG
jgi:hypothetical protein